MAYRHFATKTIPLAATSQVYKKVKQTPKDPSNLEIGDTFIYRSSVSYTCLITGMFENLYLTLVSRPDGSIVTSNYSIQRNDPRIHLS